MATDRQPVPLRGRTARLAPLDLPAALAPSDDARGVVLARSYGADSDESFVLRTSNGGGFWERAAVAADVLPLGLDTLH